MNVITSNNFRDGGFETTKQPVNLQEIKGQKFLIARMKSIC